MIEIDGELFEDPYDAFFMAGVMKILDIGFAISKTETVNKFPLGASFLGLKKDCEVIMTQDPSGIFPPMPIYYGEKDGE